MQIQQHRLKSNGSFSIIREPYNKSQHPNQQNGLDLYVDVLDHGTGNINSVKLYDNGNGLFFKKGSSFYLKHFDKVSVYVPYQIFIQ